MKTASSIVLKIASIPAVKEAVYRLLDSNESAITVALADRNVTVRKVTP